jgi:hypothetical protein
MADGYGPDIDWLGGMKPIGPAAPQGINWGLLTQNKQQQQPQPGQQPGQPLNISPTGPAGPGWTDRLRALLGGAPAPQTAPLPNPPPYPGGGPTPGSVDDVTGRVYFNPEPMNPPVYGGLDDFASRFYYEPRQGGGPVMPADQGNNASRLAGFMPTGIMPLAPGTPAGIMPQPGTPAGIMPQAPGTPANPFMPPAPGGAPAGFMPQVPPQTQMANGLMQRFGPGFGTFNSNPPPGYTSGGSIF